MATAAPAAPSPAAAPQPQAAPAPDAGTQIEAQPKRQIKPIPPPDAKPKKSAPPDINLGFQRNTSSLSGDEDIIPDLPRRDPETGKFISKDERRAKDEAALRRDFGRPELPEGAPEPVEGEKPIEKAPELPPEEAKKLVFLGKEYQQLQEIEHLHKTLQGAHHKAVEERDYGYRAAAAWEAEARRLGYGQPQGAQTPASQSAQEPPKVAGLSPESILEGAVDGQAFEIVMAREGLPSAIQYLGHEILNTVLQKVVPYVREQVAAEYGPVQQQVQASQAEQARTEQGVQIAEQLGALQGPDGKPAFPEVSNPQVMSELGELAQRFIRDPKTGWNIDTVFTHQGFMQLIAFYRMLKGFAPDQPSVLPTPTAAPSARTAVAPSGANASAALAPSEPGTATPPNSGRQVLDPSMSPLDRRLVRSLGETQLVDPQLGFRRNPRIS